MKKNNIIKVGFVGFGRIAHGNSHNEKLPFSHLDSYKNSKSKIKIVAVCISNEYDKINARKYLKDAVLYTDLNKMTKSHDLDIVSICSPTEFHTNHLLIVLKSGVKNVWLEKPLFTNKYEMNKILNFFNNDFSVANVQINYWRCFVKEIEDLIVNLKCQKFGKVKNIVGYYADDWHNNGSHLVDIIRRILIDPYIIFSSEKKEISENALLVIGGSKDSISWVAMPVSRQKFNIFELDIICENARIVISENGRSIKFYNFIKDMYFNHLNILDNNYVEIKCNWKNAFNNALDNLVSQTKSKKNFLKSPITNAIEVSKILIQAVEKIGDINVQK